MKTYKLNTDPDANHYVPKTPQKPIAENERVWIGIDAHVKTNHLTVLTSSGTVKRQSVPAGEKHIQAFLKRLPGCEIKATYEAGPTGYKLLHQLNDLGVEASITAPSLVLETKGERIKTDQRDSMRLAEQLRANLLVEVYDLGQETYEERELVRTRKRLVGDRARVKVRIKSLLTFHSIKVPEDLSSKWTKAFVAWLEGGPSKSRAINRSIKAQVHVLHALSASIRELDEEIRELAQTEKYAASMELLESIPGVGWFTAMTLLTELGDLSRFTTAEQFSSFLGLIPSESSSGEKRSQGGCVKWGNTRVRTALIEASWQLISKDPRMRRIYNRIRSRAMAQVAIVAVARRLGLVMRAMLRDKQPYHHQG
jgi:transposase